MPGRRQKKAAAAADAKVPTPAAPTPEDNERARALEALDAAQAACSSLSSIPQAAEIAEVEKDIRSWLHTAQAAAQELTDLVREREGNCDVTRLLGLRNVPPQLVHWDGEMECFRPPLA
eukprot:Hpha_TRINITY_DN1883_c0_g1::TRINITY_DN1883_c0_g1_i1::g.170434::m.170434